MKKLILALAAVCLLSGCAGGTGDAAPEERIHFEEEQSYAAAYLGYQKIDDIDYYLDKYLDGQMPPVHYISDGDFYLIIPRYEGTRLMLYKIDMETSQPSLIYEDPDCGPFIIQCNVSDIFADAAVSLTFEGGLAEFSPFISLRDGSVDMGDGALDITKQS